MAEHALVTGAAGTIGREVVGELVRRGFEVDAWDIVEPAAGPAVNPARIDLGRSVADPPGKNYRFVAHLASCTENRDDRSTLGDHLSTVAMTVNLLEALGPTPPGVVCVTSSQLVYGPGENSPDESAAVAARTAFAAAKLASEAFLEAYGYRSGAPTVAFRLSNVVGPSTGRGVIHDFVRRAAQTPGGSAVRITGATRHRRSFLTIRDCARAMVRHALDTDRKGHEVVNVANHDSVSIADIADIISGVTGVPFDVEKDSRSLAWAGDAGTVLPRIGRLTDAGWSPDATSRQAVREAAEGHWKQRAAR